MKRHHPTPPTSHLFIFLILLFVINPHSKCLTTGFTPSSHHTYLRPFYPAGWNDNNDIHDDGRRRLYRISTISSSPTTRAKKTSLLKMGWFDQQQQRTTTNNDERRTNQKSDRRGRKIQIGSNVGSGSYGTVHLCTFDDDEEEEDGRRKIMIAKRAWTLDELQSRSDSGNENISKGNKEKEEDAKLLQDRAKRCQYYLNVEAHCLEKIAPSPKKNDDDKINVPQIIGTFSDTGEYNDKGVTHKWLVFELIPRSPWLNPPSTTTSPTDVLSQPAITLSDVMEKDWVDNHHLSMLQAEFGLDSNDDDGGSTFNNVLDVSIQSLLRVVKDVHECNVVHRDIKPSNLLCDGLTQSFHLIDFGSAADLDPSKPSFFGSGGGGRVGLEDDNRVAVSPIYAAPETFIRWDRSPLNFDTFSTALIIFQLIFNLLDERIDAAFRQQLVDANFDLDIWLSRELSSTVRPDGLDDAILYLGDRSGLWKLLKDMLVADPERRISSISAYQKFEDILSSGQISSDKDKNLDGDYFESVLASFENCEIDPSSFLDKETEKTSILSSAETMVEGEEEEMGAPILVIPRPLHFVATFDRKYSLGLVLSEANVHDEDEEDRSQEDLVAWERATKNAKEGEVFIREITELGQADEMGIFEIGDRLRGVGEIPVVDSGFEKVVDMLGSQPKSAKTVKLHFDRKKSPATLSTGRSVDSNSAPPHRVNIVGQGAWSALGRRKAQEDTYVLHEVHDNNDNSVLMVGVFDGHCGNAAAQTAAQLLPSLFATELASSAGISEALTSAWKTTCNTYRNGCDENGECVADYDPREGILLASTGSKDWIAGTTAAAAVLSPSKKDDSELVILNCGDSRVLVIGRPKTKQESVIHFTTRDHSPSCTQEAARLARGKEDGLDYSQPKCSGSRWWLTVGEYQYALSRSLEGSIATSKGIVSDADVTSVNLSSGVLTERESGIVLVASDGIFEVMDNEQVGRELLKMRVEEGLSASESAKKLCNLAFLKGSSDNVSAVVVHLG